MFNRRPFSFAALFLAIGASALPAQAQTKIRISHQWSANTDARDRAARILAAEVAKRTKDLAVTVHPKSELGLGPLEQYDGLLDGRIEAAIFPLFYIAPRIKELSVTLLPGLPANIEQANRLKNTDFHRRLQSVAKDNGFHILTWWWLQGGMVSIDPEIGGPDDMKGIHIRSGDSLFDLMFEKAGAVPMTMPSTEIVEMMENDRLNIAQASLETLLSMKMQNVAKSAVIGGNALYVSLHPLVVSLKTWQSLTDAQRKALEDAAEVAEKDFVQTQQRIEADARKAFTSAGVKVRPMEYAEYERWLKLAYATSWTAYSKQSQASAELLQSAMSSLINSQSAPAKR